MGIDFLSSQFHAEFSQKQLTVALHSPKGRPSDPTQPRNPEIFRSCNVRVRRQLNLFWMGSSII